MPKKADEINKVLHDILSVLRGSTESKKSRDEAESRDRQNLFQERMGLVSHAAIRTGQAAGGLLAGAALATGPNITGSIVANAQSFLGDIGTNETFIRQAVRLSGAIRDMKDHWRGLSQETKSYAINSAIAFTAAGTAIAGGMRAFGTFRSVAPGAASSVAGFASSFGGLGAIGAGYALNQTVGRNLAGDALIAGGMIHAGYQASTVLGPAMQRAGIARMAAGGGNSGAALALAGTAINRLALPITAIAALNQFSPSGGVASSTDQRVNKIESALAEHEYSWFGRITNPVDSRMAALRAQGFTNEQINSASQRAGFGNNVFNNPSSPGGAMYNMSLGQTQMTKLARELAYPNSTIEGSEANILSKRSEILSSLNFQSKQFGIGDLHDVIQQQAVMDPAQRDERRRLLLALEGWERELQLAREARERNEAPVSANAVGSGNTAGGAMNAAKALFDLFK